MATVVNHAGETNGAARIEAGDYDTDGAWSFDAADGDKLLGDGGDDWTNYGKWHLGIDTAADDTTKAHYKYPFGKDGKVYRSALRAIRSRSAQQGDTSVYEAAGRLMDAMDKKEDAADGGSDEDKEGAIRRRAETRKIRRRALAGYRVALRRELVGIPLLVSRRALERGLAAASSGAPLPLRAWDDGYDADDDGAQEPERRPYAVTDAGIAIIDVAGPLVQRGSWFMQACFGVTGYEFLAEELAQALADPAVQAIVFRCDSPGGAVAGCFDFVDELYAARGAKPLIACVDEMACSAAYAIASACDRIYLPRTAMVGSVGVVALHVDFSAQDEMLGEQWTYVFAGEKKIDGNPHAPLSRSARADLQGEIDQAYELFIETVARNRGIDAAAVRGTEAAVYAGAAAVEIGFADKILPFRQALAALGAEFGAAEADPPPLFGGDDEPEETAPQMTLGDRRTRELAGGAAMHIRDLLARMRAASVDLDQRTAEIVIATETPVRIYDYDRRRWADEVLGCRPGEIRLARFDAGLPLLDGHGERALDLRLADQIGAAVPGSAIIANGELRGTFLFSDKPGAEQALRDVASGVLRGASAGYLVHRYRIDETTSPPTYRAVDWEPVEATALPIPADPKAGFRSLSRATRPATLHERTSEVEKTAAAGAKPANDDAVRTQAIEAERTRTSGIRATARKLTLPPEMVEQALDEGLSLEAFRERALDHVAQHGTTAGPIVSVRPSPDAEAVTTPTAKSGGFKTFGEHLAAVARYSISGNDSGALDKRLVRAPTGAGEVGPDAGGFLVQTDFYAEIMQRAFTGGKILSRVFKLPISTSANGIKIPGIDETSRATGSRWGGVSMAWASEGDAGGTGKPKFRLIELDLKKLLGFWNVSDELLEDTTALTAIGTVAFTQEYIFMVEDGCFRGTGAGQPLGILKAPAKVTIAKEQGQAAATIVMNNLTKMWAALDERSEENSVWMCNRNAIPQLIALNAPIGTAGALVFMPPGGLSGTPYGSLLGRPVMTTEYNETLGTEGDIVLVDWSQYVMCDKAALQAMSSMHVRFLTDEMVFRFRYRVDGQPAWHSAVTPYKGAAGEKRSPYITLANR